MGCRCADRAKALHHGAGAALRGDVRAVKSDLRFVALTAREDFRAAAALAKAKVMARVGRGG